MACDHGCFLVLTTAARCVGTILSAFFYGYIVTQIPGGYLATRYGGKYVFGIGVLCSSILNIITPFVAPYQEALIAARILDGLFQVCYDRGITSVWFDMHGSSLIPVLCRG
jgi:MFS family permease